MACIDDQNETAVKNFRDYLRIPTVHPNINFDKCVSFLKNISDELGLKFQVFEFVPSKPIIIMTLLGFSPDEPSVLLNSHMDVVPVVEKNWKHRPFEAEMDEDGNIFGRGAQDMKCVPIMYLEAIRRLICKGVRIKRTFHLSFMPDEEVGGRDGMGTFVTKPEFEALNVGFALDEGCVSPTNYFPVFYGENICWQIEIHCSGKSGHGSDLQTNTAGEKLCRILTKFMEYRDKILEEKKTSTRTPTTESITSVNLTKVSGGIQANVLPDEITATFDIRLSIYEDLFSFQQMLNEWFCAADVSHEFILKDIKRPESIINCSNPFWKAMTAATAKLEIEIAPQISPGMTDIRYIRELEIPALGFTPINETDVMIHGDDEYIPKDKFLQGIKIYMEIFKEIGNV